MPALNSDGSWWHVWSIVPVLSTETKIIPTTVPFIPVSFLELELELEHNFACLKTEIRARTLKKFRTNTGTGVCPSYTVFINEMANTI